MALRLFNPLKSRYLGLNEYTIDSAAQFSGLPARISLLSRPNCRLGFRHPR